VILLLSLAEANLQNPPVDEILGRVEALTAEKEKILS
jgi:hypothetical protein